MSVTTDIQDGIAHIQMNDGKANAFGFVHMEALHAALDEIESTAKAVVFSGIAGRFSGGFDLNVMREGTREDAARLVNEGGKINLRVFEFPLPTIMAVTGHAMAQGAYFVLTGDTRIGAEGDFKLGLPETAIAMTLPEFGVQLPHARLDPKYHTLAVIQAYNFSPQEAMDAGFLDRIVSPDKVIDTALETAGLLGALPQAAYAANKKHIRKPYIDAIRASLK